MVELHPRKESSMPHTIYRTPVVHGVSYAPLVWTSHPALPSDDFRPTAEDRPAIAASLEICKKVGESSSSAQRNTGRRLRRPRHDHSLATDPTWIREAQSWIFSGVFRHRNQFARPTNLSRFSVPPVA